MIRSAGLCVSLLGGLALSSQAPPQSGNIVHCQQGVTIGVDSGIDPKTGLFGAVYTISDTTGVTGAWMEWRIGPKRYGRERVPIDTEGHAVVRASLEDHGQADYADHLQIGIAGLSYGPLGGDNYTDWSRVRLPSFEVFDYVEAGVGPRIFQERWAPWPELDSDPVRVVEQRGSIDVVLSGRYLTPTTKIALLDPVTGSESAWRVRHYLPATNVDFGHVRVTLATDDVSHPSKLTLLPLADDIDVQAGIKYGLSSSAGSIYVVSTESPALETIDPVSLPARPQTVTLTLRGRGFSTRSRVVEGSRAENDFGQPVQFVSPTELRVAVDVKPDNGFYYSGPLVLSVVDGDDLTRWSESRTIDRPRLDGAKNVPPWPRIRSISPYPIPLFDDRSPERVLLRISGEHFTRDQTVVAGIDNSDRTFKLTTSYISSRELTAWLPTKVWYWKRSSYRFVIEKDRALCAVETFDFYNGYRTFSDRTAQD